MLNDNHNNFDCVQIIFNDNQRSNPIWTAWTLIAILETTRFQNIMMMICYYAIAGRIRIYFAQWYKFAQPAKKLY